MSGVPDGKRQDQEDLLSSDPSAPADASAEDPGFTQVYHFLSYGLSLPERALRSTTALVGGAVTESATLLVPQAFRSSKSYEVFVQQMLDFAVRDVGGVDRRGDGVQEEDDRVQGFVVRKTVGNLIDLAGLATLHLSPLTVLAIVSDVAYGSQAYLKELSIELKKAGVIDDNSTIDSATDLLDAVRDATSVAASAFDTPPLSIDGLQQTIEQTKEAVASIDPTQVLPANEVQKLWEEIYEIAVREHVGVLDVSSTVSLYAVDKVGTLAEGTLSSVVVAGNMFDRHILDHYRQGLNEIRENGLYATLATTAKPYLGAVWNNFSTDKTTLTQDVLTGRLFGRAWGGMRAWLAGGESDKER
ncbi:MAG: hypothetical protein ACC628_15465 [Pirellulaceae bacterium]